MTVLTRSLRLSAPAATLLAVAAVGGTVVAKTSWQGFGALAGLVAIAGGTVLVLRRPLLGALLLVGVVPVVSGFKRGLPVPGFRPSEVLIVWLLPVLLLVWREPVRRWSTFDWIAVAYAGATALLGAFDLIERGAGFTSDDVNKLAGPVQFFVIYRLVARVATTAEHRRRAIRWILIASVPVSLISICQTLGLFGARSLAAFITGADYTQQAGYLKVPRATGPFPVWHMLGGYLFVVLMLGITLLMERAPAILSRRAVAGVLLLAGFALAATATLAPIIGAIVGAMILAIRFRRLTRYAAVLGVAGIAVLALFGPILVNRYGQQFGNSAALGSGHLPQTIAFRWQVWTQQYLPVLSHHWLTGWGPDTPTQITWPYTETVYLTMLMRGGVILLGIYAWLMLAFGRVGWRAARSDEPERRAIGHALVLVVLILVPMHFLAPYFVGSGLPHLMWGLAGLAVGGLGLARAGHETEPD